MKVKASSVFIQRILIRKKFNFFRPSLYAMFCRYAVFSRVVQPEKNCLNDLNGRGYIASFSLNSVFLSPKIAIEILPTASDTFRLSSVGRF